MFNVKMLMIRVYHVQYNCYELKLYLCLTLLFLIMKTIKGFKSNKLYIIYIKGQFPRVSVRIFLFYQKLKLKTLRGKTVAQLCTMNCRQFGDLQKFIVKSQQKSHVAKTLNIIMLHRINNKINYSWLQEHNNAKIYLFYFKTIFVYSPYKKCYNSAYF